MASAGERYRETQRKADPSRDEPEPAPVGGPGSGGEASRQRANTYLNNERLILNVLRSAIRRMKQTGRIDTDVLNAYAKIKSERTERENSGVGMDGPTQRAERWLNGLDAAGKIPSIYAADWANMTRAKNKALEEQDSNATMFLEDDLRGKRPAPTPQQGAASTLLPDPNQSYLPDYSNQFGEPGPAFDLQTPVVQPELDEEQKKSSGLRNPFNSLFAYYG